VNFFITKELILERLRLDYPKLQNIEHGFLCHSVFVKKIEILDHNTLKIFNNLGQKNM
jgi:hypothetical protein